MADFMTEIDHIPAEIIKEWLQKTLTSDFEGFEDHKILLNLFVTDLIHYHARPS